MSELDFNNVHIKALETSLESLDAEAVSGRATRGLLLEVASRLGITAEGNRDFEALQNFEGRASRQRSLIAKLLGGVVKRVDEKDDKEVDEKVDEEVKRKRGERKRSRGEISK